MVEHFTAQLHARKQGAIGIFYPVKLDFKQVGAPRQLTPTERTESAIIAAGQVGWEVHHVVDVQPRRAPATDHEIQDRLRDEIANTGDC